MKRLYHPALDAQLDELTSWLTSGQPLALDPDWITRMLAANSVSRREVEGFFFLFDEKEPLAYTVRNGVAILPIHGPLARKSAFRTTYGEISEQVARAAEDRKVRAILLDVDSPGGVVSGMHEAAAAVRTASLAKPTWAVANDYMASAAYGVASGASKIITTRYGTTGSIGTVLVHLDFSKHNEQLGVNPTYIVGGRKKAWANPDQPLNAEPRAELQALVDHHYLAFAGMVAEHRGLDLAKVLATEAGSYLPNEARALGLVDGVQSFDECASALAAEGRAKKMADDDKDRKDAPVGAEVVSIDDARDRARAEGRREAAEYARGVQKLCALAGMSDLAADFIEKGASLSEIGDSLLALRAKKDEEVGDVSGVHGRTGSMPVRPLAEAMVDLIKARGLKPRANIMLPAAAAASGGKE